MTLPNGDLRKKQCDAGDWAAVKAGVPNSVKPASHKQYLRGYSIFTMETCAFCTARSLDW